MADKLPISLCTFVKNEERNLRDCLETIFPIVSEVVIVDTGSTDRTLKIARKYTNRVYRVGFTDFGSIRTLTAHLASQPWVFMLDADERIDSADWSKLEALVDRPAGVSGDNMELDAEGNVVIDSWALPRKRWADRWRHTQVDVESYPDWQVRLFRNHTNRPKIWFRRRVHETVAGCIKTGYAAEGPVIHHHQNERKTEEALRDRAALYTTLYRLDLEEGVEHTEPPVLDIDCGTIAHG